MKLLRADIFGFGKFYRRSFSFQDGIHVISGPNESGKSTLHAFIGAMLFGLERSRGKAARSDLYSRYLPWEHDGAYGGSLSFESDDLTCTVERSLRSDKKSCRLTKEGQGSALCASGKLPEEILEGLTESVFSNTISIRQLRAAPDASLAEQLAMCFSDIRQSGDPSIHCDRALARLRAEKKQRESLLDPGLDSAVNRLAQEKLRLEKLLADTSFRGRKEQLEEEIEDCLNQLDREPTVLQDNGDALDEDVDRGRSRTAGPLIAVLLILAAVFLFINNLLLPAALTGLAAALVLFGTILRSRSRSDAGPAAGQNAARQRKKERQDALRQERQQKQQQKQQQESLQRREALRFRLKECRRLYQEASRRQWDWEQALEKLQDTEEELAALKEKAAAQDNIRLDIQAIGLAMSALTRLAGMQTSRLGPRLDRSLSRILSGLTGGAYQELSIDDSLNLSVRADGRTVLASSLSQGTLEQIWLALRLAAIDVLFPQGGMPLLLDDCFLAYDDDRLTHTLRWLAENYSGQVFIFTCQKREAALLKEEQIPFTLVEL